jgi:hypothetical protein
MGRVSDLWPFDYPASVVEQDTAVIFGLDVDLVITYCNAAWDAFALANGARELCRPAPIGHCILEFIGGAEREYYAEKYKQVLIGSEPWEHSYECSSKSVFRQFQLRVVPMKKVPGLFAINSLRVERLHDRVPCPPLEEQYRHAGTGLITMCGSCRRTRRLAPGPPVWDWVPDFIDPFPTSTTHGICPPCCQLYYPDQ